MWSPDRVRRWFLGLHQLSRLSIKLGASLMACFYIVGLVSLLSAPYVSNWSHAMTLCSGCMEAAPASLAAGFCAGLLGDMMMTAAGVKKNDDK